jgi:hypothetical protein
MTAVTIIDETTSGGEENTFTLEFLDERVTVRELIRSRVYQEVTEHNAGARGLFRGLVQPAGSQRTRGGFLVPGNRALDWEQQYERALTAFESNGFVLLLDDRQVESLDDVVLLRHDSKVTFLRLMPLVGG